MKNKFIKYFMGLFFLGSLFPDLLTAQGLGLKIVDQPFFTIAGEPVSNNPAVQLTDSAGNIQVQQEVPVVVSINQNRFTGQGDLSEPSVIKVLTDTNGIAEFDKLILEKADLGYSLCFGVGDDTDEWRGFRGFSSSINSTGVQAFSQSSSKDGVLYVEYSASTSGNDAKVGYRIGTVEHILLDGNTSKTGSFSIDYNAGETVSLFLISGGASSSLEITNLSFSANIIRSSEFPVIHAKGNSMQVASQPVDTFAGEIITAGNGVYPEVKVYDKFDNLVEGVNVDVSVSGVDFANQSISVTRKLSDINGSSVWNGLVITKAGRYQLTFTPRSTSVPVINSEYFNVLSTDLDNIFLIRQPSNVRVGDIQSTSIVQVEDRFGNVLGGIDVQVAGDAVSGTFDVSTDVNGQAKFEDLVYAQTGIGKRLTFSVGTNFSVESASFNVETRPLVIQGVDTEKEYGTNDPVLDFDIISGSLVLGDSLSGSLGRSQGEDVGSYSYTLGDLSHPNYNITIVGGRLIVNPRNLAIKVNDAERRVDGPDPEFSFDDFSASLVNGDSMDDVTGGFVEFVLLTTNPDSPKGFYSNEIGIRLASLNGPKSDNYAILVQRGSLTITAGIIPKLILVSDAAQTVAGSPIEGLNLQIVNEEITNPAVQAHDGNGDPISGLVVQVTLKRAFNADLGGVDFVSGTLSKQTDINGIAVFDDLVITKAGVDYILEFNADESSSNLSGFNSLATEEFSVIAANPSIIEITDEPKSIIAGGRTDSSVYLADEFGNPILKSGIRIIVELQTGAFSSGLTRKLTDGEGFVQFSDLEIQSAGNYNLAFTSNLSGVARKLSEGFIVSPDVNNAFMSIATQPTITVAGTIVQGYPAAQVTDPFGNGITGVSINASLNGGVLNSGMLSQNTDDSGLAVFNDWIINTARTGYSVNFSSLVYGTIVSEPFEVIAAPLDNFSVFESDNGPISQKVAGEIFGIDITANDVFGNTVKTFNGSVGINVVNSLLGNGTGSPNVPVTTPNFAGGVLSGFSVNLIQAAAMVKIGVNSSGKIGESNEFAVVADEPSSLIIEQEPGKTVAGLPLTNDNSLFPKIRLTDVFGNPVSGQLISVSVNQSRFLPISDSEGFTDSGGKIEFSNLILTEALTGYELTFVAEALPNQPVKSQQFDIVPDEAAEIFLVYHPRFSMIGWPVRDFDGIFGPTVWVSDQYLNPIPEALVNVELLQFGSSVDYLSGTTNGLTNAQGEVEFLDLFISRAGYAFSLRFSSGSAVANSFEFIVLHGKPTQIFIETQPSNGLSGVPLNPAPTVKLVDDFGNPVPNGLVYVSEIGGAPIVEGWAQRTGQNGIAAFNNLVISNAGSNYQLVFEAQIDRIVAVTSANFDLSPAMGRVAGRYLVYNNSFYDGNNVGLNDQDDNAIATDKTPLFPGFRASHVNVSNYSKGINSIIVDLADSSNEISIDDFDFRVGNTNNLDAWENAPVPAELNVRVGSGVGGSNRVTIRWQDKAILGKWLEVTIKSSQNTGLENEDRFYFGNAPADTQNSAFDFLVNATDLRRLVVGGSYNQSDVNLTNLFDYNKDGKVNFDDYIIGQISGTTGESQLILLVVP